MTSYVQTYIQRDVRLLRNITSLGDFTRFVMLCATRAGQLINREDMARAIGADTKTIQAWLGILESSYIIYLLQPWYNNMNKRIVKRSEEHTSELQSLMRISYAVFCLKKKKNNNIKREYIQNKSIAQK